MTPHGVEVCLPLRSCDARSALHIATRAHDLGVSGVWVSELASYDAVAVAAVALHRWPTLRVGTAIVPIGTRTAASLALSAATLGALGGPRAVLGVGVSTRTVIEGWHGCVWEAPVQRLRQALATVSTLLDGTPGRGGMRLEAVAERPRIHVAALGPRMTEVARSEADGLLLNLIPTSVLADVVGEAPSPEFETCLPVRVAVHRDQAMLDEAVERQRRELASYLSVDVYARAFRGWGWGDVVDLVAGAGGGAGAAAAVPDRLVHDVAIFGDVAHCQARLRDMHAAGVRPLVVPVAPPGDADAFVNVLDAVVTTV